MFIQELRQVVKAVEADLVAKIEAHRALALELNATEDKNGRYHAPKGGTWYDGKFYVGGEYLPFEDSFRKPISAKAKINYKDFYEIKNLVKNAEHGKVWEQNGEKFCYIYFSCYRSKTIADFITKYYQEVKEKKEAERKANIGESPSGKIEVIAKILSFKLDYYYGGTKMLVEFSNGSRAFGTKPKGNFYKGDTIKFKADFQIKEKGFSFFKRPKFLGTM